MGKACGNCRKPIEFRKTENGKNMPCEKSPIDATEAENGHLYLTEDGRTIRFESTNSEHLKEEVLWVPHWNNCGNAQSFRRPR